MCFFLYTSQFSLILISVIYLKMDSLTELLVSLSMYAIIYFFRFNAPYYVSILIMHSDLNIPFDLL